MPPAPPSETTPDPIKQERDWTLYTHLSGLCWVVGIPSFVGPLICWLIKKDTFSRVDLAGKEAVNFHLTMLIFQLISVPLIFLFGLGMVTMIAIALITLIFPLVASSAASKGDDYIYPLTFRMIQ